MPVDISGLNPIYRSYLKIVTHYPKSVLLILTLILFGLLAGLPNFKLDASADKLTLENDTDLDYFRDVSKRFDSGDFLVVTFTPNDDLFSDTSLSLLQNLQDDLSAVEGVVGVNSILTVPLLYSPKLSLTAMAGEPRTLLTQGVDRQAAKNEFWNSPIYKDLILGPDGQTTAIQLNIAVDRQFLELVQERDALISKQAREALNSDELRRLEQVKTEFTFYRTEADARSRLRVQQVRDIVDKYKGSAQIFVGGVSMIAADMIAFIQSDLVVFGIAVVLFMILVLAFIFRSVKFVVIPMVCCLTAVAMMLGYVSWLDWRLTVISSNFVALLLIISLSIIIHLIVRFREYEASNPEWSKVDLVHATVIFMARPCFYTAITTIVAFASLVVSGIRPVIDFGWMMTIGLVVALALAFLILPASLVLLPKSSSQESAENKNTKPLTAYLASFVERRGWIVVVAAIVVFGLSVFGITKLKVENRFVDYFHESTEIYQGLTVIDNNLGGTISMSILIDSPKQVAVAQSDAFAEDEFEDDSGFGDDSAFEEDTGFDDGFADEASDDGFDDFGEDSSASGQSSSSNHWMTVGGLKQVQWLHDYLESLPEVGKVQSLATFYKVGLDINGSLNDFELALMKNVLSRDVQEVLISPYLSPDGNQARITFRVIDTYPGLERAELVERIRSHILASAPFAAEDTRFTGLLILYNNMLQSLFSSQILTLGVVFLAIFLMLAVLFKSIFVATVAIIPNAIVALSVLGTMGLIGIPLDMMTITVAAIAVGIGVDHTIHYIHRFKTELRVDANYMSAMHRSHASIGRAMYYTAIIIIFGFGIMVLSRFIPTIYFGLLTGFAMFASLIGSLLLLPKLILLTKPLGAQKD